MKLQTILALTTLVCGTLLALYTGFWVLFVGGISQILTSALVSMPIYPLGIAVGILKVILAGPIGWSIFFVTLAITSVLD